MNHISEEGLLEHYYGEGDDPSLEEHLGQCKECRKRLAGLQSLLRQVDAFQAPRRPEDYGAQVYRRLRPRLGEGSWWNSLIHWRPPRLVWAPTLALLLVAAFLSGRYWDAAQGPDPAISAAGQQVLLLEVGQHLQQAHFLLVEVGNVAPEDGTRMELERRQASEMAADGWLYRRAAERTGDPALVETLEQLQRFLLDIANGPTTWTAEEIEALQQRLKEAGLPMRIQVLENRVRQQQIEAARSRARRSL
ncbi:MAG TPA: hypothetical protein VLU25_20555 [Acidobacteriota bacterium]|nr:hypothetical protein [Acidobacteriota bacterium]